MFQQSISPFRYPAVIANKPLRIFLFLSLVFLTVSGLNVFQDFLQSIRNGNSFYLDESLLFKLFWMLFIPLLTGLYIQIKKEVPDSISKTLAYIFIPAMIHLAILPFVALLFSQFWFGGAYDLYKFFSYTLANDLYKLLVVYSSFVLGHKHFFSRTKTISFPEPKSFRDTLLIQNGKENVLVKVQDILQVTADAPYVSVHLNGKKHLYSGTLKSIGLELDPRIFVRVHRSTLVNVNKVRSFKSRLNGDYDLLLENGDSVRLSRTFAMEFKELFKSGPQLSL